MRFKKDIHYFYKIINLVNGKFYYGIRTCHNCFPGQDTDYMGSGTIITYAINKYGRDKFKKIILRVLPTREDARDLERWIVDEKMTKNPMCYNLVLGGEVCTRYKGAIEKLSDEFPEVHEKMMEKFNLKCEIARSKRGEDTSTYGCKAMNKDGVNKYIKNEKVSKYLKMGWKLGKTPLTALSRHLRLPVIIHKFEEINKLSNLAHSIYSDLNEDYTSSIAKVPRIIKTDEQVLSDAVNSLNEYYSHLTEINYVLSDDSGKEVVINSMLVPLYEAFGYNVLRRKLNNYSKRNSSPTEGRTRIINLQTLRSKFVKDSDINEYVLNGEYILYSEYINKINESAPPKLHLYHKGDEEVMIKSDEIPDYRSKGYKRGAAKKPYISEYIRPKSSANSKGSKVMNKDGVNQMVAPDHIQQYLDDGWKMGNDKSLDTKYGRRSKKAV